MQSSKAAFLVLTILSTLSGCVVSGGGLEDAVDRTATNTVPTAEPAAPRPTALDQSDQNTVRNAVSSASIQGAETQQPMAWANADTGASGVISNIQERRAGNMICRQFRTSRQRFDGVALYSGEACTKGQGEWTLTKFSEGT